MTSHQRPQNDSQAAEDRSSLNDLELASPRAYNLMPEETIASSIPLPDSVHESSDAESLTVSHTSPEPDSSTRPYQSTKPYLSIVRSLHEHLPHLQNVLRKGRGKPAKIECYEYAERKLVLHRTFHFAESTECLSEDNNSLGQYLHYVPPNPVQFQLLVATDLSIPLMDCLGSSLGISPEAFEEHLINSGWCDGYHDDPESNTWITRNMIKDYVSLKWYRPVKRILSSEYDSPRWSLPSDNAEGVKWTKTLRNASKKPVQIEYNVKPCTNIFRRGWDLRTDPRAPWVAAPSSGWEERATIWTRKYKTCRTVVLLLDPLPMLQVQQDEVQIRLGMSMRQHKDRHWARTTIARLTRQKPLSGTNVVDSEQPTIPEMRDGAENVSTQVSNHLIYELSTPRGPMIKYDSIIWPENTEKLVAHVSCTKSTGGDLSDYLTPDEVNPQEESQAKDPLDYLFTIIHSDILNMLHLMDLALSQIGHQMLNETSIQQRLVHWRNLLEKFDTKLNRLEVSLPNSMSFLEGFDYGFHDFPAFKARTTQCTITITRLQQRTEQINKLLMANMSMIESKRGIAEAESVTKLTELAFFFIPLTFSASILGMQVRELSESEVSLWMFFLLAIAIMTSSYAVRLIIRSKRVIRLRHNLFKRIREEYDLEPDDPIPTTIFLAWTWRHVGTVSRLTLAIAIVSPILLSTVWTSSLAGGIKVGITILTSFMLGMPFAWVAFKTLYEEMDDNRSYAEEMARESRGNTVTLTQPVSKELGTATLMR